MSRSEHGPADAELVLRARKGDAGAFEALVRRHYRAAYAVARSKVDNSMDAEDVVQDAFVRTLERLDDCEPAKFAAWLLAVVRNHAHNRRIYESRRGGVDPEEAGLSGAPDAGAAPERAELRDRLDAAVSTLSEVQREVLLLHDLEGLRHAEIGEIVGVSEGMSRYHLMHARRRMRELLSREVRDD